MITRFSFLRLCQRRSNVPCQWSIVLAGLLAAAVPLTVSAQEDARPPEVALLQDFGTNGELTFDGMRRYLAATAFVPLDANEDLVLDIEEYTAARLYQRPGTCGRPSDATTRFNEERQLAKGPLTADGLSTVNGAWKSHIDAMTTAHWERSRAADQKATLDLTAVTAYLAGEKKRTSAASTAKSREEALLKRLGGLPESIPELTLREFIYEEQFDKLDLDASRGIDVVEFATAFPAFEASAEFCAVAGSDFLLDFQEFGAQNALAPNLLRFRAALFPFFGDVPLTDVRKRFEEDERAGAADAKLRDVPPHGYVEGYGFLVSGRRIVEEKKIARDADLSAVFIRVVKDFTFDDPTTAEPATFSVTKDKGRAATIALDAAFQVDFDPTSKVLQRISAGVDVERNTAADPQVHRQRYYAALDLFLFDAGKPVESHAIRLAPFFENDDKKDVQRLAGDVIWTPGLHIGRFLSSQWRPIGPHADWYVTPRVVLELATIVGDPKGEVDGTHARLELLWGFKAGRFNTTFKTFRRRGINNELGYSHFEELSAWWDFDDLKRFSVKSTASWGKASPTDVANKTTFTTGLGIRF